MAQQEPSKKNPFAEIGKGNIKLKKVKNISDKSGPQLTGYLTSDQIAEYDEYIKSFDIEQWYEPLKDVTFPTKYVNITFEEGQIINHICDRLSDLKKQIAITGDKDSENKLIEQIDKARNFSKLDSLSSRIDTAIEEWKGAEEDQKENEVYVFAKLSSRSAKDAMDKRLQSLFDEYCKDEQVKDDNDRLFALIKAATHCLKVSSAKEILSMFVDSERIRFDLASALKYKKEKFAQNVVLRKWIPIDVDMEFRGFVFNNSLNALSQYNHFIFFERLVQKKDILQQRILDFFDNRIKEKLGKYEGYIVDFAVCGVNLDKIYVIELNPFMSTTEPGLFSWKTEMEKLKNGPFEFRIRSEKPGKRVKIEQKYQVMLGWGK